MSTVWSTRWPLWTQKRLRGLRLTATDVPWAAGTGQEVRGPIAALLVTLTGRSAALDQLEGAGTDNLTSRLPASPRPNEANRAPR